MRFQRSGVIDLDDSDALSEVSSLASNPQEPTEHSQADLQKLPADSDQSIEPIPEQLRVRAPLVKAPEPADENLE